MAIEYGDGSDSNGGRVIRIIQQTHHTESTSTGISGYTNTPFPALTVTPESTNSRILLMCSFDYGILNTTSVAFRWTRNNSAIGSQEAGFVCPGPGNNAWRIRANNHFLDHPNTTSSRTYRLQFRPYDSGRTVYWHNSGSGSNVDDYNSRATFQLIEFAGLG